MTLWYCENCVFNKEYCGPWNDDDEYFSNIRKAHKNHPGFQIGEPPTQKLTEIEQLFTDYFNSHADEMLHRLIAKLKGPDKVCLIREKWKWVSRA